MTPILRILHKSLLAGLLLSGVQAFAQGATTSSDVQLSNGMVMATCETNLDENADYFYEAKVGCVLTDGSGNTLASGNDLNSSGDAVVVLQVQGVPGTTYIVTGSHSAQMNFKEAAQDNNDYPGSRPPPPDYIDEYNYASLDGGEPAPYLPDYSYEGPGPENDTTGKFESLGETTDSLTDALVPTTTVLTSNTLTTYTNQTVTSCDGTQVYANNAYGYGRCIDYQLYDQNTQPLLQAISVHEVITDIASNFTSVKMTGDEASNSNGIFEDFVALIGTSPPPANACAYAQQTFTAEGQTIRVNCLHYTATDVTVSNITTNPNSCSTNTCP